MNITLITFVGATLLVAIATILIVRRMQHSQNAIDDFFAGGRALAWPIVAGSLLLTNLSTEQLVGLNGAVFKDGRLVGIAWEVLSAFAMIATAMLFLPKYLASGFTTTTAFLEKRYDRTTRMMVSGLFLFGYVTVLLPVVLYTGAVALRAMFDLEMDLWKIIVGIGALGSLYAIVGGLRAVAVSDTLNGIGLLVGGLSIPLLALAKLGDGSVMSGLSMLVQDKPETLSPLAMTNKDGGQVSVPWPTLLTGMVFIQVFYWSTNQVIVQRAMGAKNLATGQKGVLFAAAMKILGPIMLCLPGIIALHMTDTLQIAKDDEVYPTIVRHVLPHWALGLFCAVIVGAILSSFNSALNSAATLFCLDFYEPIKNRRNPNGTSVKHVVVVGQVFATILAIVAMIVAPMLEQMQSIFDYLQKVNGLYSVPIILIFLVGVLNKRASSAGAKAAMIAGIVSYAGFTFADTIIPSLQWPSWYHWLHGYGISVLIAFIALVITTAIIPRSDQSLAHDAQAQLSPVDMTPWKRAPIVAGAIATCAVLVYVTLFVLSH